MERWITKEEIEELAFKSSLMSKSRVKREPITVPDFLDFFHKTHRLPFVCIELHGLSSCHVIFAQNTLVKINGGVVECVHNEPRRLMVMTHTTANAALNFYTFRGASKNKYNLSVGYDGVLRT